jgi:hypothetical protein
VRGRAAWALAVAAPLALGCSLLREPEPKGRTVLMEEPERPRTLCDGAPAPPRHVADAEVNASFALFAQSWMEKLRKESVPRGGDLLFVGDATETELRETGHEAAPYVGILRHCELTLSCPGDDADDCRVLRRSVVTEIFRYQAGEWVY